MKSIALANRIRRVEAYRLIDILIIGGLTALVVIQAYNVASGIA